jgi:hypothetical protein
LAYDRAHHRVWVPAGETGTIAVVDVRDDRVVSVPGFATAEIERRGTKRIVGPSSATVGEGVVYVGNRGDSSVCALGAESLRLGPCVRLAAMPDGLAYVSSTHEVWVTTPRANAITILDATAPSALTVKATIPSGAHRKDLRSTIRGVFYTNLEDQDHADDRPHEPAGHAHLDAGLRRGRPARLVIDPCLDLLVVACTDHLVVLDAGHDGTRRSTMAVGDGLDDLALLESRHDVFAAAGRAATLTIAHLDAEGGLTPRAVEATRVGARNAVVTEDGVAYLTDGAEGRSWSSRPPAISGARPDLPHRFGNRYTRRREIVALAVLDERPSPPQIVGVADLTGIGVLPATKSEERNRERFANRERQEPVGIRQNGRWIWSTRPCAEHTGGRRVRALTDRREAYRDLYLYPLRVNRRAL